MDTKKSKYILLSLMVSVRGEINYLTGIGDRSLYSVQRTEMKIMSISLHERGPLLVRHNCSMNEDKKRKN